MSTMKSGCLTKKDGKMRIRAFPVSILARNYEIKIQFQTTFILLFLCVNAHQIMTIAVEDTFKKFA